MNCQQLEMIITSLARRRAIMETAARESGLAHTKTCPRCAARLADEQALSIGLQAVARASVETEAAPAGVEEKLRAAFRERSTTVFAATSHPDAATPPTATIRWHRRPPHLTAAAAAAVLLIIGLVAATRLLNNPAAVVPVEKARGVRQQEAVTPEDAFALKESPPPRTAESASDPQINYEPDELMIQPSSLPRTGTMRMARGGAAHRSDSSRGSAPRTAIDTAPREIENAPGDAGEGEIATDFLPFMTAGDPPSSLEGGQVVRVELPRSALASFGLTTNMERSGERVKADVLIGEDGVARAIRFVR